MENLESLFRATHLFGQDDQELLLQFRKRSVIPSDFLTRMLALEDYATGSSKANEVAGVAGVMAAKSKDGLALISEEIEAKKKILREASRTGAL